MTFDVDQKPLVAGGYRALHLRANSKDGLVAMTVIEVAAATGVSGAAIRWYVRNGLLKPQRNSGNGYYHFGAADLRELRFIGQAKALGFTLAEIKAVLEQSRRRESPCPAVRDIMKRRMVEVTSRLESLQAMERHMRRALRLWKRMPDGLPHGAEVCRLIDAFSADFDLRAARSFTMRRRRVKKPASKVA
jgi:MerR family transcriptional regulator, Zn(II)-responsive regulator of zntA